MNHAKIRVYPSIFSKIRELDFDSLVGTDYVTR